MKKHEKIITVIIILMLILFNIVKLLENNIKISITPIDKLDTLVENKKTIVTPAAKTNTEKKT